MAINPIDWDLDLEISRDVRDKIENMKSLLALPDNKKRDMLRNVGRRVRRERIAEVKQQKNLDGSGYDPRKNKDTKGRKKMFPKLLKKTKVFADSEIFRVWWTKKEYGRWAMQHQTGAKVSYAATATQMKSAAAKRGEDYAGPATRAQAKALKKAGYKVPVASKNKKGKSRYRVPSIKWMTENLSFAKAGLVLSILTGKTEKKSVWQVSYKLPKRELLGASSSNVGMMINEVLDNFERNRSK